MSMSDLDSILYSLYTNLVQSRLAGGRKSDRMEVTAGPWQLNCSTFYFAVPRLSEVGFPAVNVILSY